MTSAYMSSPFSSMTSISSPVSSPSSSFQSSANLLFDTLRQPHPDINMISEYVHDHNDINILDQNGNNLLIVSAMYGHFACLCMFIANKINIDHINDHGNTALIIAVINKHYNCVVELIQAGANIDYMNISTGYSAFLWSCIIGNYDAMKTLADAGADVHSVNKLNNNAVMLATRHGNYLCLVYLIELGVDVCHVNDFGDTALIYAGYFGYLDCLKLLIEAGSYIKYENIYGITVLDVVDKQKECRNYLQSLFK